MLSWSQMWKYISLVIIFVKLWGLKDCHFGDFDQLGTINARYNSRYQGVSRDLIRLRKRSKLVERSLFAIIDLLHGAKSIVLILYGVWGDNFHRNLFNFFFRKIFFSFHFIFLNFLCCLCYNCSINVKRQSEISEFCRDTSSLVNFWKLLKLNRKMEKISFFVSLSPTR